jgi:hypothetical protein
MISFEELCSCVRCVDRRTLIMKAHGASWSATLPGPLLSGWRYACVKCGNKRCPHHTDHNLACTNSNEPGQAGSDWV